MSEKPEAPETAPTEPAPPRPPEYQVGGIDGAPMVLMKGGTTSSRHDREVAEREAMAELGRNQMAKQDRAAAFGEGFTDKGFVASRVDSIRMMDEGTPRLVLYYLNRDRSIRQECIAELFVMPDGQDSGFVLVCPKCLERRIPMGQAQVKVMRSHRHFDLDPAFAGKTAVLRDPDGVPFQVKICGKVTCRDVIRCDAPGCTWAVRVTDSNLSEV